LNDFAWDRVAIVGVGLIGGSIGMSVLDRKLAREVIGIGRDATRLQTAVERQAITHFATDLAEGVAGAELVIVCSPVDLIPSIVGQVMKHCPATAIITDAGSTKQQIVAEVARLERTLTGPHATFIGSHPLAGSEKTGVANARHDLLRGRTVVMTPSASTDHAKLRRLEGFWTSLEAIVVTMDAGDHDEALAITSHLPHVAASALAAVTPEEYLPLVATGWLDTTRIAGGDIELWRQILTQNRTSVLRGLEEFAKVLDSFRRAIEQRDDAAISELLAHGKQRRDALAD
jgi:prephenate dehydrogenase